MRLFLALMILFFTLTSSSTAEASDCCQPHDCAVMQAAGDLNGDCSDDAGHADADCPDCCTSFNLIGPLPAKIARPEPANLVLALFGDDFMAGLGPSGLLKPPRLI